MQDRLGKVTLRILVIEYYMRCEPQAARLGGKKKKKKKELKELRKQVGSLSPAALTSALAAASGHRVHLFVSFPLDLVV
jgi:hypothetical protein